MKQTLRTVIMALACGASSLALAQTPPGNKQQVLTPQGEYAQIDTKLSQSVLGLLNQGAADDRTLVLETVREKPWRFQPPVLYAVSYICMQAGQPEEAAFWFYAGQLRARIDANLSADRSAGQAVQVLNERYGSRINQYLFQDLERAERILSQVMAWDERTAYDYDRRWINLHGMGAMLAATNPQSAARSLSQPQEQWPQLTAQTRAEYAKGFAEVLQELRQSPPKAQPHD